MEQQTEFAGRRERLRLALDEAQADAFLITALPNVRYLAGFTGSNAALLVTRDRELLFTDPRYQTQAPLESDCEIRIAKGPLTTELLRWTKRLKLKSLAFEQTRVSYDTYRLLSEKAQGVKLKPVAEAIERIRMIKSGAEIATIRTSVQLNSKALEQGLRHFRRTMTEADLAAEIDYRMRRLGADGNAFDTIVASGAHSALPHAHPSEQPIESNQLLLIDMGASVAGYASDMTRTMAVGKLNPKMRKLYQAVLESQLAALDSIRPGVTCASVDRAARTVLGRHGLDKAFIHSTGHGLGLEIHEAPRIGRKEQMKLEPGMAITVEPGAYLEGIGGVRIEDTVVVTGAGCEVLTPTGKELIVL